MAQKYLIQTKDADDNDVFLGENEWRNHILNKHPEIQPFIIEIKEAVSNPHERQRDPEDERVFLHYYKVSKSKQLHSNLKYLLVVIKYVNAPERNFVRTGFISSVYFVKEIKKRGKQL